MIEIKSTKKFKYLPCAHSQWFDTEPDGSPGECASVHGYDREVEFTFAGDIDDMGWIVPFGELGAVKKFLEYYFDHVTVLPANDPRLPGLIQADEASGGLLTGPGGILGTLRVLPSGVSMEMSSLFIWEHVNPYIYKVTNGRCYVSRVQVFEHDRNSGILECERSDASNQANHYLRVNKELLPKVAIWQHQKPNDALDAVRG